MKEFQAFAAIVGSTLAAGVASAQTVALPQDIKDRLQQQAPAEQRKMTVAPTTPPLSKQISSELDKMRSVQDLLEQVERTKGAPSGTLKAVSGPGSAMNLQHDLAKIRGSFTAVTDAPFGSLFSARTPDASALIANTPATVEYKTKDGSDAAEEIVSIKARAGVAANAFASGERPASLRVANANLSATQVVSSDAELAVDVRVGGETRRLKVGEVSRFENFEVMVLASVNRSGKRSYEGFPYVLRLQIMPLR